MAFFYKIFLDWVWIKLSSLVILLVGKVKSVLAEKKIEEVNDTQAEIVEKLRQEKIVLIKAGQIVPKELEDKLRIESHKLISSGISSQ